MRENCLIFGCVLSSDRYTQAQNTSKPPLYISIHIRARKPPPHKPQAHYIHRYIYTPPHHTEQTLTYCIHPYTNTTSQHQHHHTSTRTRHKPHQHHKYINIYLHTKSQHAPSSRQTASNSASNPPYQQRQNTTIARHERVNRHTISQTHSKRL